MQVAGRKEKGAEGESVHAFDVEIGKDGKIMLNGTDLSALLLTPEEVKTPATPKKAP